MRRACARLIRTMVIPAIVLAAVHPLGAWQWPVDDFSIAVSFGELTGDGVSPGLKLVSDTAPVSPAAEGEVVFALNADTGQGAVPHGLGSFVVLEHEGGFRSLYAHLAGHNPAGDPRYRESEALGGIGQAGFSGGNTLGFRIIDTERRAYVNPMLLLPELDDGAAPRVEDIGLSRGDARFSAGQQAGLPAGPAELTALVYDPAARGLYRGAAAAYSVVVFLNGREQFRLSLDTVSRESGGVSVSGEHPAQELYDDDGRLRLGRVEIVPGSNLIEIVAEDYAGNERVVSVRVTGEGER